MINHIIITALDKRKNLWSSLKQECLKLGFNVETFISGDGSDNSLIYNQIDDNTLPLPEMGSINYMTWYNRPNAYNAWKSHKKIIQTCLDKNYQSILFIEDDSYFIDSFLNKLDYIKSFFQKRKWDMIYLGSYCNPTNFDQVDQYIYKLNGKDCGGFHGVILTKKILQKLSHFRPLGPFDWMACKYLHSSNNCYVVYPSIILQSSGYSYVEGHNLTKLEEN